MTDRQSEDLTPPNAAVADDLRSVRRRRPFQVGVVVGALIAIAVALLVVQNGHRTSVEWLWFDFTTAQWLVLAVTFAGGVVVAETARVAIRWARGRAAARRDALDDASRRLRAQ